MLRFFSGNLQVSQIDKHQMIVGSAADEIDAALHQTVCKRRSVQHNLLLIAFKFIGERFAEADGLGRNHMHQRASLDSREHSFINLLCIFRGTEDHSAARTAQRLMRRCRRKMCIRHWAGMKSCDMRHINHKIRADLIRDLPEFLKINDSGICACAGDDHLRLMLLRQSPNFLIIDQHVLFTDVVRYDLKPFPRHVDGTAMRQMAAIRKTHPQNLVSRLQHCKKHGHIRLCAGVRLHVRMLGAKQLFGALNSKIFYNINVFATAVITFSRISFCVFVCQRAAHRLHDRFTDKIFRSDQFDLIPLPGKFLFDRVGDFRIRFSYDIGFIHCNNPPE